MGEGSGLDPSSVSGYSSSQADRLGTRHYIPLGNYLFKVLFM